MNILQLLENVELFDGLATGHLREIAKICQEKSYYKGEIICHQGEMGDELYIIAVGLVEVQLEDDTRVPSKSIVQLGEGQPVGEIALLDRGPRTATLKAITDPTLVLTISRDKLLSLIDGNKTIGYFIMRNLALDLSFKLRHRNIRERGRHERL
jgi:CRP-like cAMP-binding protein